MHDKIAQPKKINNTISNGDVKLTLTADTASTQSAKGALTVTSSFDYTHESIKRLYDDVFKNKPLNNIFLRYEWISTWLKCASSRPELVTFLTPCGIYTIGFALIGSKNTPFGKEFFLNQTGDKQDDQIWIEYNDVICASKHQACRDALLAHLLSKPKAFKFTAVNCVELWPNEDWRTWSQEPCNGYIAASVELSTTQEADKPSLITHFSKNTKSQISRSLRFIEQQFGDVKMQWLDTNDIEPALTEMGALHIEQWEQHDYGSGFTNPQFVEFHRQFMLSGLPSDMPSDSANCPLNKNSAENVKVHLAKFTAGELTLGYLYFFTYHQQVYFYLSAINYHSKDNKYKPGLLMHKLAMTHFAKIGYKYYDFLAGDSRYKTSLSNKKYLLHSLQLYVNKWYYLPIKQCVNIKRWLVHRAKKQ